jgi:flagellin-like hook-associated protein FlgL
MAGLLPIPTTRITGLYARQRLTQQLQLDQLDLFRLQDQVSTGQRIILPSDDAPSALRAIALQRLIERKGQLQGNIAAGRSFLNATDSALNSVADQLIDVKGATLEVVGTVTTEQQRNAAIAKINNVLESLVGTANTQFRGRYLFAGTQTSQRPYTFAGDNVFYGGDAGSVQSYSDVGVLFSSNAAGISVFGGISNAVLGAVDLNPQLSEQTLLSSLRGGLGIKPNGAIAVSDGTSTSIIDLSGAVTVGDVKRLIEENAPGSREITVTVTGQGINLQFDPSTPANIIVQEVGSGTAARDLGILSPGGVGTPQIVGEDLDPILRKTTSLDALLGTKARAKLVSTNENNDILLEASANGTALDGVTVQLVDDDLLSAAAGLSAGNEVAVYDANARAASAALTFSGGNNDLIITATSTGIDFNNVRVGITNSGTGPATANYDTVNKVLTINLASDGSSTANDVIFAIGNLGGGEFNATLDDSIETTNDGSGNIAPLTQAGFGNTGNSGGEAKTLYVRIDPGATTANQVISAIITEGTFTARIDPADSSSLTEAGTGKVTLSATATTSGGSGTTLDKSGLRVVNGGQTYDIGFSSAETVNDLLNIVNGSDAGLYAEINAAGTGVNIHSRLSGNDFQIGENGGQTATQLGLRTYTESTKLSDLNYGVGVPTVTGTDFTITTADGQTFDINLSAEQTVGDVLETINGVTGGPLGAVEARLATFGNGIELIDNTGGGGQLEVSEGLSNQAAEYLGLIPAGADLNSSGTGTLTGTDRNFQETESVFTTLLQLRDALAANDTAAISRAAEKLDVDLNRVVFARSEVGARLQGLDISQRSLEDEDVQLRSALSDEIDVDLVEAISNLTARQISLQASLQATANLLQLSLLDFI